MVDMGKWDLRVGDGDGGQTSLLATEEFPAGWGREFAFNTDAVIVLCLLSFPRINSYKDLTDTALFLKLFHILSWSKT